MTIEEILKNAGIEDEKAIEAVKSELPRAYMPLAEANKRIAAAKTASEELQRQFDAYKAEAEKAAAEAAAENEGKEGEAAKALAELQAKFDKLQGDYDSSKNELRQGKARGELEKALKDAGANPAALALLVGAGMAKVEYDEEGKPSNISNVAETIKGENGGLFGRKLDTGKPQEKGDGNQPDEVEAAFARGFGKLE